MNTCLNCIYFRFRRGWLDIKTMQIKSTAKVYCALGQIPLTITIKNSNQDREFIWITDKTLFERNLSILQNHKCFVNASD